MEILIVLAVLTFLFWLGFSITGAMLSACFWLIVKLPIAVVLFSIGLTCCITILLIPLGLKCFKLAGRILF